MAKIKVTNPKYVIDAHLKTNYFKLRNTGGPKGDKGDTGETGATGPEGPQGATGATGRAATVAIGTTQTLNPGQSAFVNNAGTNNDAIFNFGIPQGEKGDKGDTGATGATGQAATVTVGTTTTLAAGSDATVTNSGTSSAAVLNFGIPKGDKGDTGEKGDTGGVRSEYVTELPASGQENTYYLTGDTATTGTASGESFQVTNNDNTGQVLLTQLNGNATQDGTPTPDAPIAIETVTGGQTVGVVGKNLFNVLAVGEVADHLVNNGDGTLTVTTYNNNTFVNNGKTLAELCPSLKVGDTATLSATSTGTGKLIYLTDGGGSWNFGTSKTITSAMLAGKVCFYASGVSTTATISDIQLELGTTATTYEPYQGQEFPIDLGSIELAKIGTYQDRIYKNDGKWYIEKQVGKVVFDGTEAWVATGGGNGYRIAQSDIILTSANTLAPILSDYFTTATFSSIYNATVDYGIANHNSNHWIVLRDKNWTSASDVTTWLSTHNTTVYYALATPTTTEITDDTLLAQLNTISELYGGVNNISIVPSIGAQGTITVKYTTWDKNNRYDVYIWNDTIGDFQIIHSGGGNN